MLVVNGGKKGLNTQKMLLENGIEASHLHLVPALVPKIKSGVTESQCPCPKSNHQHEKPHLTNPDDFLLK